MPGWPPCSTGSPWVGEACRPAPAGGPTLQASPALSTSFWGGGRRLAAAAPVHRAVAQGDRAAGLQAMSASSRATGAATQHVLTACMGPAGTARPAVQPAEGGPGTALDMPGVATWRLPGWHGQRLGGGALRGRRRLLQRVLPLPGCILRSLVLQLRPVRLASAARGCAGGGGGGRRGGGPSAAAVEICWGRLCAREQLVQPRVGCPGSSPRTRTSAVAHLSGLNAGSAVLRQAGGSKDDQVRAAVCRAAPVSCLEGLVWPCVVPARLCRCPAITITLAQVHSPCRRCAARSRRPASVCSAGPPPSSAARRACWWPPARSAPLGWACPAGQPCRPLSASSARCVPGARPPAGAGGPWGAWSPGAQTARAAASRPLRTAPCHLSRLRVPGASGRPLVCFGQSLAQAQAQVPGCARGASRPASHGRL